MGSQAGAAAVGGHAPGPGARCPHGTVTDEGGGDLANPNALRVFVSPWEIEFLGLQTAPARRSLSETENLGFRSSRTLYVRVPWLVYRVPCAVCGVRSDTRVHAPPGASSFELELRIVRGNGHGARSQAVTVASGGTAAAAAAAAASIDEAVPHHPIALMGGRAKLTGCGPRAAGHGLRATGCGRTAR